MNFAAAGRFLLLFSLAIWIGSIVFFGTSVAPHTFQFAREWQVKGVHPELQMLIEQPRTLAGYMNAGFVRDLNNIGNTCLFAGSLALLLCWFPKDQRSMYLLLKTALFFLIGLLHYIMTYVVSDEMFQLLGASLLNFDDAAAGADEVRFNYLHGWYSRLAAFQIGIALILSLVITFKPFRTTGTSLA